MKDTSTSTAAPQRILVRRIRSGSLLALIFAGTAGVVFPAFFLLGILALFGANTVRFADKPVTGPMGLVAAMLMTPFFTLFVSLFAWVGGYFGIRIWGRFKPIILEYIPGDQKPE